MNTDAAAELNAQVQNLKFEVDDLKRQLANQESSFESRIANLQDDMRQLRQWADNHEFNAHQA